MSRAAFALITSDIVVGHTRKKIVIFVIVADMIPTEPGKLALMIASFWRPVRGIGCAICPFAFAQGCGLCFRLGGGDADRIEVFGVQFHENKYAV